MRCPVSTYIYSEAMDRNPNKRSNLGVTQLYPGSQHCKEKHTEGWVEQEIEHTNNISSEGLVFPLSYSTMAPTNSNFEVIP